MYTVDVYVVKCIDQERRRVRLTLSEISSRVSSHVLPTSPLSWQWTIMLDSRSFLGIFKFSVRYAILWLEFRKKVLLNYVYQ